MKASNKYQYKLMVLLLIGLIFGFSSMKPLSVQAAKESGRMNAMILGHGSGEDLDFYLYIEVGKTRYEKINPRYWITKHIDSTGLSSPFTEDEYVNKHNKEYVKEKKGYQLEDVSADSSIVKVITKPGGAYSAKGLKEGRTVIRFYETYLGKKHYLGCRDVIVGPADMVDETMTLFIGSELYLPTKWETLDYFWYDTHKGTDLSIKVENKKIFTYDKKVDRYTAAKIGESKAYIMIQGKKKSFNVKIIEPVISKQAKLNYTMNAGYVMYVKDYLHLFDYDIENEVLEFVSDEPDIAEIKYTKARLGWYGHFLYTKQPGTAHIKVYSKLKDKKKLLGEITIKVLKTDITVNDKDMAADINTDQNLVSDINENKDTNANKDTNTKVNDSKNNKLQILNKVSELKVGENYQFISNWVDGIDFYEWNVYGDDIGLMEGDGLFTALSPGVATIEVSGENYLDSYEITIKENDLESAKGKRAISIAGPAELSGEDYVEYIASSYGVTWSVSNPDIVMLIPDDDKVKLIICGTGRFTLYADTDSHHGQLSIVINEIPDPVED